MEYSTNQLIVDKFQQLIEIRDKELQDYKTHHIDKKYVSPLLFKVRNYKLGLEFIKNFPTSIEDSKQLKGNKGIGDGILKRVQEILETKTLHTNYFSILDFIKNNEKNNLTHIVTDNHNESKILKDLFLNDEKYPYLVKVYDSIEHGYKYHVKVYKINYNQFIEN